MALQPLPGTYSLDKAVSPSSQNVTKNAIPDRTLAAEEFMIISILSHSEKGCVSGYGVVSLSWNTRISFIFHSLSLNQCLYIHCRHTKCTEENSRPYTIATTLDDWTRILYSQNMPLLNYLNDWDVFSIYAQSHKFSLRTHTKDSVHRAWKCRDVS